MGSLSLITARISFLDARLTLIHIPIKQYSFFVQPILRALFGEDHDEDAAHIPWTNRHEFLNISITPVECSVICSKDLADRLFRPLADAISQLGSCSNPDGETEKVKFSSDTFIVIQVEGQSLDAGQRVLELTAPLAMAGISIFFLTTYFSDYILVPSRARRTVTTTLEQRGFAFSTSADAFVNQFSTSPSRHMRQGSSSSSEAHPETPPTTPPAKDVPELQQRTFARLKRNNISPHVDRSIKLLSCAGSNECDSQMDTKLKDDLLQVLISTSPADAVSATANPERPIPSSATRFLSLTLTSTDPISVFLEQSLLSRLGDSLMGSKEEEDILVPITLDLRDLPMEATGIVCGVAGRLAQGTANHKLSLAAADSLEPVEISFLSTARAGTVIVREKDLDKALKVLEEATDVLVKEH